MLCPECKVPAKGGSICPECGQPVPERESFGGQGRHYLGVLSAISLLLFIGFLWFSSGGAGLGTMLARWAQTGRLWFYLALFASPIAVGVYYWFMLREEEITITDEYIARRSNWGDERMEWAQVREFHRTPIPFRQTRLGRITGLSQVLTKRRLFMRLTPATYELVSVPNGQGEVRVFVLEPGTVDDLPWLLQLIYERLGPPIEEQPAAVPAGRER
jgi:hypothetical protein